MNTLRSYLDRSFMGYLQKIRNRFINTLLDCLDLYASHTAKLRGDFFCQIIDMLLFQFSKFFLWLRNPAGVLACEDFNSYKCLFPCG